MADRSSCQLVVEAGPRAAKRFANFFGSIANDNTRAAYQRAVQNFFAWCEWNGIVELADIEPIHIGAYIKSMADTFEKPTIKQHLAAKQHKLRLLPHGFYRLWGTPMSGYALDNSWDRAKRRLALLEAFLDPKTKRRMLALGVSQGWTCLEIAAGGGSIARWLSEAVGAGGKVMATDINTALLRTFLRPTWKR